jgi:hypothetical protein
MSATTNQPSKGTTWANNEVASIAWDIDGKIDGCLGFDVTRIYRQADGTEERVHDATWAAFKG